MTEILRETRRAALGLAREPGLTATVVLTLALGIGANTALFAYLCVFLWPTLDAPHPEALFRVQDAGDQISWGRVSYDDFADYRAGSDELFDGLAAHRGYGASLRRGDETLFAWGSLVSADYFGLFGKAPLHGRWIGPEDGRPGAPRVVVLGYPFWRRHFGADPAAVGETVHLEGELPYTIVGVAPRGFQGPGLPMAVYTPLAHWPDLARGLDERAVGTVDVLGRLAAGASRESAAAALKAVAAGIDEVAPRETARELRLVPLAGPEAAWDDPMTGRAKVLMAVVGLFLLLAAVNVANLLLARGVARRRDLAVRAALGAGRWRLVRRIVLESLLLAGAGGALGVGLGYLGTLALEPLMRIVPVGFGAWGEGATVIAFDGRMALFAFAAALVATLVFGAAPVVEVLRRDLVAPLKSDAAGGVGGGRSGPRRALVVLQVALAVALLLGAGLLVRSLWSLGRVDLGFDPENLFLASVYVPDEGADFASTGGRYRELAERARSLPGVAGAGLTARPPLFGGSFGEPLLVPDRPGDGEPVDLHTNLVSPGYFETLGVPLVDGRDFTDRDREGAPNAVVVNETAAERLWPGRSPLGREVVIAGSGRAEERGQRFQVVGVVADHRYGGPTVETGSLVYFPVAQRPRARLTVMLRSERPAAWLGASFRSLLEVDFPDLALIELAPLGDQLRRSLFEERLNTRVATAVGLLALLLAGLGLASLMAFQVARRRREIAVRMAVGAAPADAVALVLRHTGVLVGLGLALGLAAAAGLARLLQSMLYGIAPYDPLTAAGVLAALAATALAATWLPARRAARVDPAATLKGD
jgi:putative ABC transport system permease protein